SFTTKSRSSQQKTGPGTLLLSKQQCSTAPPPTTFTRQTTQNPLSVPHRDHSRSSDEKLQPQASAKNALALRFSFRSHSTARPAYEPSGILATSCARTSKTTFLTRQQIRRP